MKIGLAIVGVLVVAALGYYFLMPTPTPSETPTDSMSEGKIDINVVCEGALAYMTFTDGAEAEAWVAACKRGEHPEAVEQWKVQMGITDDRAI